LIELYLICLERLNLGDAVFLSLGNSKLATCEELFKKRVSKFNSSTCPVLIGSTSNASLGFNDRNERIWYFSKE